MDTKDMITGINISEFGRQSISARLSGECDFLAEFQQFDSDGIDETKKDTLQAMELATAMG